MKKQVKGFTLLELMVTIAIIGILAVIAAPNFSRIMAKNRLNMVVAEWRSAFYLAQKEAIRTKKRMYLCPSEDGRICHPTNKTDYSIGWIVATEDKRIFRDYPVKINGIRLNLNIRNGGEIYFEKNGRLPSSFAGASVAGKMEEVNFEAKNENYTDVKVTLAISRSGRITKGNKI